MQNSIIKEGKTFAIVSYLTFVGLIIAIIMNSDRKNPFTSYHIRQMLGLIIMLLFSNLVEKYVNSWLETVFWIVTFVAWLFGLVHAILEQYKPIPFLGDKFQEWFKNLQ